MMIRLLFVSALLFTLAASAAAEEITVTAIPIDSFKDARIGERVDGLIWRGGIQLNSDAVEFGGLSGVAFTGVEQRVTFVSDQGWFISGQIIYNEKGQPLELVGVDASAI
jgi:hypothetical protein